MKGKRDEWEGEKEAPPEQASARKHRNHFQWVVLYPLWSLQVFCTNPEATDNSLVGQVCFASGTVPCLGGDTTRATGWGHSTRSFQGHFGGPFPSTTQNLKQGCRHRGSPLSDAPLVWYFKFSSFFLALSNRKRLQVSRAGEAIIWVYSVGLAMKKIPYKASVGRDSHKNRLQWLGIQIINGISPFKGEQKSYTVLLPLLLIFHTAFGTVF